MSKEPVPFEPDRHPGWDLALRLGLGDRGQAVVDYLDARTERKARRLRCFIENAAAAPGEPQEVFEAVAADDRLGDLFDEAAAAATSTPWQAKIKVLGKALALALATNDDATVGHAELLARAVADLEPVHARALWIFGHFVKINPTAVATDNRDLPGMIARFIPGSVPVSDQIAGVLRRHGLVSEPFWANGLVELTPFGAEILGLILDAGGLEEHHSIVEGGPVTGSYLHTRANS